jgi:hypothetical protein
MLGKYTEIGIPDSIKIDKNFQQLRMALVHKSKSRRNPRIRHERSGNPVALRHAQMSHLVQSHAAD